jgi:hypothetical protein
VTLRTKGVPWIRREFDWRSKPCSSRRTRAPYVEFQPSIRMRIVSPRATFAFSSLDRPASQSVAGKANHTMKLTFKLTTLIAAGALCTVHVEGGVVSRKYLTLFLSCVVLWPESVASAAFLAVSSVSVHRSFPSLAPFLAWHLTHRVTPEGATARLPSRRSASCAPQVVLTAKSSSSYFCRRNCPPYPPYPSSA